jgi:hypothetical protein
MAHLLAFCRIRKRIFVSFRIFKTPSSDSADWRESVCSCIGDLYLTAILIHGMKSCALWGAVVQWLARSLSDPQVLGSVLNTAIFHMIVRQP